MVRKKNILIGTGVVLALVLLIVFMGVRQQTSFDTIRYPVQAAEQARWDSLLNELQSPKDVDSCSGRIMQCGSRISFGDRTFDPSDNLALRPFFSYHPENTANPFWKLDTSGFVTGKTLTSPTYFYEGATNVVNVEVSSTVATNARLIAWVEGINEGYDLTKENVFLKEGMTEFAFILPKELQVAEFYRLVVVPVHLYPFTTGEIRAHVPACPEQPNIGTEHQYGNTGGFCNGHEYAVYGDPIIMNFQINVQDFAVRDPSEPCPVGFAPESEDSELCRNVKYAGQGCLDPNIRCPITVCPKDIVSKDGVLICKAGDRIGYECGVNAICTIPVLKVSEESACRDQGKVYDNRSGTCYNAAYYNTLTCTKDSECVTGCPEVTATCQSGMCVPSGSCNPPTIDELRSVALQNENLKKQPENPIKEVVILPPSNTFKILAGVLGLLVAVLVVVILSFSFGRRKRR